MGTKNKPKPNRNLNALCEAVRAVRRASGKSQESFSQLAEISSQTLSRFERGQPPRSRDVLNRLAAVAFDLGCTIEEEVFRQASLALPGGPSRFESSINVPTHTPIQWRLMQGIRIAQAYFPQEAAAAERELARSLELVDEIIADTAAGDRKVTTQFYANLESELNERAARKLFQDKFTKEGKLK